MTAMNGEFTRKGTLNPPNATFYNLYPRDHSWDSTTQWERRSDTQEFEPAETVTGAQAFDTASKPQPERELSLSVAEHAMANADVYIVPEALAGVQRSFGELYAG